LTKIKICGITEVIYARAALEARADLIGVVFAPSPRQVTPEKAREIVSAIKEDKLPVVGVFVNTPAEIVNRVATFCGLDRVQLSGNETWEYCQQIEKPIIKAIRVSSKWSPERLLKHLQKGHQLLGHKSILYLMDTLAENQYGGTGQTFDWGIAEIPVSRFPLIIAGGLNAGNVGQVVAKLKPWGVDVSSGIETDGVKSIEKIRAFIQAVRSVSQ